METLQNLEPLLRTFWYIAIPSSLIFIIQTIMTFVGGDVMDGVEADFDGDLEGGGAPFQMFSLRNLINFLIGLSWTGISFYDYIESPILLCILALGVGVFFVWFFFLVIRQLQKLAEDNSFQLPNTIGKVAEVYLTIPANKGGKGKILISVKGATHELDAISEEEVDIKTGAMVKVTTLDNNIAVVKPL